MGFGALVHAWVCYSGPRLQPALMWFHSPTAQIIWSIQLSAESLTHTLTLTHLRPSGETALAGSVSYSFCALCLTIPSMSFSLSLSLSVLRGSWGFVTHLTGAINSSACAVLIRTSDSSLYMFWESTILYSENVTLNTQGKKYRRKAVQFCWTLKKKWSIRLSHYVRP